MPLQFDYKFSKKSLLPLVTSVEPKLTVSAPRLAPAMIEISLAGGKTAERKMEKLPNEIWKSCRPKSGKTAERALYRFAMCDKIRRK